MKREEKYGVIYWAPKDEELGGRMRRRGARRGRRQYFRLTAQEVVKKKDPGLYPDGACYAVGSRHGRAL
jgi:hypothetical protein